MIIKGVPLATKSRSLRERPALVAGRVTGTAKPASVTYGAMAGYLFPIFASDDQECYFRNSVPRRWDGESNPLFVIVCALASANSAGKKFQWQLSWNKVTPTATGAVLPATTIDVDSGDITLTSDNNAQYAVHVITWELDYDNASLASNMTMGDDFFLRLRRIANTGGGDRRLQET